MRNVSLKDLDLEKEKKLNRFRTTIYGSARIKKGEPVYEQVFDLAKGIAELGGDVITGGGPGLMQAANEGHNAGDKDDKYESIGLNIQLDFEQHVNEYVEFKKEFMRFAERLEAFSALSSVFIVSPGGVGTSLEFFYTWQLLQVKKMEFKPIILVGEMWSRLIYWVIDYALKDKLMSSKDFEFIYIAKNNKEALELVSEFKKQFEADGKCYPIKDWKERV